MARRILRIQRRQLCPACLDRDAVNMVGMPRGLRGFRGTHGCEVCEGRGRVTYGYGRGDEWYDPWVVRRLGGEEKAA